HYGSDSNHIDDMPSVASVSISDNGSRLHGGRVLSEDANSEMSGDVDAVVKIALSLYKVQQNIYLLDFQKVE
ncbi:unnamed protein product, partial [Symbiodinium microadriaticum]